MRLLGTQAVLASATGAKSLATATLDRMGEIAALSPAGGAEQMMFGLVAPYAAILGLYRAAGLEKVLEYARAALRDPNREKIGKRIALELLGQLGIANADRSLIDEALDQMPNYQTRSWTLPSFDGQLLVGAFLRHTGELEKSRQSLEVEVAFCRTAAARPRLAMALFELSETTVLYGATGRSKVIALQDEAL